MASRSIFDLLVLSETGLGFSLWMTVFRQYRTFTLWRQKAASTLPCSQGARLSPLISLGGALEVCHGGVGGWRGSQREFYVGGYLCVTVCLGETV